MSTGVGHTGARPVEPREGVTPPTGGRRSGFLSDVLVELGFASPEAIEQAVRAARSPGTTVARALVDMGAITEEQLARATAERHGVDYIDLAGFAVDPAAANLIKPTAARRYQAVPVAYVEGGLLVAMADPADTLGINDISLMAKHDVRPAVAARPALVALVEALPLDEEGWDGHDERPAGEAPEEAETPASSAVFWQDGEDEELPAAGPPPPGTGDAPRLRAELALLQAQLAGAEAKLRRGRQRADDGAIEELHARLAAAEAELAEARARNGPAAAAEAEELRTQVIRLRQERDELRAELRRVEADAELRTSELESLRAKLTQVETELVRVRAEADARGAELVAVRTRAEGAEHETEQALRRASESETDAEAALRRAAEAERQAEEARRRAAELEHDAAEVQRLTAELAASDARAEQARQALVQLRAESERERERAAATEADLREKLGEEARRRAELEGRLSEVEGAALAAERSFEELRLAQGRMRGALRALPDADAD